jgi:hypothetical protein
MDTRHPLIALGLALALAASLAAQEAVATMKAVRFHAFGKAEVLKLEDVPKPVPTAAQILVRVHAAGVNPVDWKVREGLLKAMNPTLPQTPGYDIAGVVESVGADVKRFKAGDEVMGYLALRRGGAYAEYAIALENELALKPKKLDFVKSAAIPLAALTAWQALFDRADLKEGQTVLVHAGAGGVGHFAVQLAKAKGARVIATASKANHEFLTTIGASEVIDYKAQRFEELVRDVDLVLDPIGALLRRPEEGRDGRLDRRSSGGREAEGARHPRRGLLGPAELRGAGPDRRAGRRGQARARGQLGLAPRLGRRSPHPERDGPHARQDRAPGGPDAAQVTAPGTAPGART